ncbi:MAG: AAA family ATPase [Microscillaceae bacterium]|nr:AAA family ATPase [Microscillaceae bacterium]
MKLPYGISNFKDLVEQGYFFMDRTSYIEYLEGLGEKYIFFLRPRRFGKSIFLSMLAHYYDLNEKDNFQVLFGKYYIGQHPTEMANQYAVLRFEFSGIPTQTPDSTLQGFLDNVRSGITEFLNRYPLLSTEEQEDILEQTQPQAVIRKFFDAWKPKNQKIYLLIDEYDHFANELLAFNLDNFMNIVSRNGFVRKFYETLKTGTFEGTIDRMFVTGVTPITLDSLTSGFNIASHLSLHRDLHAMLGFSEEEVKQLLKNGDTEAGEELMEDIQKWYNGYRFHKEGHQVYNPDMVLYFAKEYLRSGKYPDQMLDVNVASDYGKLRRLFALRNPAQNFEVLNDLVQKPSVPAILTAQFSFEKEFSRNDFLSLLFYMGFITHYAETPFHSFRIPNEVIRALYLEYFIHLLKEREGLSFTEEAVGEAILQMGFYENIEPFFRIIESILQELSRRDYQNFDEKYIKLLILATSMISNQYFHLESERETKGGYIDILFLEKKPFKVYHQYAIELKYLKKEESKQLETTQQKAATQLRDYIRSEKRLTEMQNLKAYTLVVVKDELHWKEIS